MTHKELDGFDAYIEAQIVPLFSAMQEARKKAYALRRKGLWVGALVGLALSAAVFLIWQNLIVALGVLVAGPAIGALPGALGLFGAKADFASANVGLVAKFLNLKYVEDNFTPSHMELLERAKLVPDHDRAKFTELVQGERHGVLFTLFEASLDQRIVTSNGKTQTVHWVPVFFGQFLHIPYHRPFSSHTLIARDAGWFNGVSGPGKGLKRVGLVDPKFEKIFEVYSTDQVEGRYLVDPGFMERLLHLEGNNKKRDLQAAFFEQAVMISITGGDGFYPDVSDTEEGAKAAALETANVFLNIFDLVDGLLGKSLKK